MDNVYAGRIQALRELMAARGWDAVVVTGSDPHGSEYPADRYKQVRWLTGFTGEAGDVVVTMDHAGLWTDTRYFIQATAQLAGTGVELHKTRIPEQVLIPEWLAGKFKDRPVIAVDGLCMSASAAAELEPAGSVEAVPDLLDSIWTDRPQIPATPVFTVESGETCREKIEWLRSRYRAAGCDGILLSALDDIAWTLNVRASDIEYNPLAISYLLVSETDVRWFVKKEGRQAVPELEGVGNEDYSDIDRALSVFPGKLYVDSSTLNCHLAGVLHSDGTFAGPSPVQRRKAVKNSFEQDGMRDVHLKDGVAMEKFLYWLETSVLSGKTVTEWDAAQQLGKIRAEISGYRGDSFETISAYGAGAALPHYITPKKNAPVLEPHGLYLCDSGGQYLRGTTDITRTMPLGPCSELEREDYTLVLKGHIDLAMAVFPAGTAGCQIDALAREPLWRTRRNFGHGTGHGVGFFLGVHEGPQDIRQNFNTQPLLPGMIVSDEPGIYRENMHGVRHENLLMVVPDGNNEFGSWLRFETLTLCHFDTSSIKPGILFADEMEWLNTYHRRVRETLSPYLSEEEAAWLYDKTKEIR